MSSNSQKIKKLDLEISKLMKQISTLNRELVKKENLKRKLEKESDKDMGGLQAPVVKTGHVEKVKKEKDKERTRILTRASERLTMGTKTFNKPCKKADYEKGAKRGKYICSKASDGYRYRPLGNPGDINYSDEDVVHAEGKSFKHTIGGKIGPRYGWDDINDKRNEQIREYESLIKKMMVEEQMKPGGNVERAVALMSGPRYMRQAQIEGEGLIGDDDFKEPSSEPSGEPEPSPEDPQEFENPSWKPARTSGPLPKRSQKKKIPRKKKEFIKKKRSKNKKNKRRR